MAKKTKIQWTDATWSPLRVRVRQDAAEIAKAKGYISLIPIVETMIGHVGPHCEKVSHGCDHCYSCTDNHRRLPANGTGLPFDRRSRDLVDVFVDEKILLQPLRWRQPKKIFVENQSDLFGEWVTDEMLDEVFAAMAVMLQHMKQVLTKRGARMLSYVNDPATPKRIGKILEDRYGLGAFPDGITWPIRSVWLGVSVENQQTADERIPLLLKTPAAVKFVSYEPALGPVDLSRWTEEGLECGSCGWAGCESQATEAGPEDDPGFACPNCEEMCMHTPLDELLGAKRGISWVIAGGESGPGARPAHPDWFRVPRDQCREAGAAFLFKQWGAWSPTVYSKRRELVAGGDGTHHAMFKVGKKKAGALLDGREWREFPHA